jgi:hypothetical protein
MSYIIRLIAFLFLNFQMLGQVGIKTTDPQATLHVAEESSTIKIEGLSFLNNNNNLGSNSSTRVFVNSFGDLVLGNRNDNINFILDIADYIPNNREFNFPQTGTGENFTYLVPNSYTFQTFTLTQEAIVEINYSVSWRIRKNNSQKVSDRGARSVETAVYILNNATSSYLPKTYALTGQFYSNGDTQLGAAGFFYNTGSDYVLLNAGTYTIHFGGRVTGGGNENITIYFGGDNDQLQIVAYY